MQAREKSDFSMFAPFLQQVSNFSCCMPTWHCQGMHPSHKARGLREFGAALSAASQQCCLCVCILYVHGCVHGLSFEAKLLSRLFPALGAAGLPEKVPCTRRGEPLASQLSQHLMPTADQLRIGCRAIKKGVCMPELQCKTAHV